MACAGVEAEWTIGRGPQLSADYLRIDSGALSGGYVQLNLRAARPPVTWFPFARWSQYDGGRKFARNAPHERVNELDIGLEVAAWAGLEATVMYTWTFERTRTSAFPYPTARDGNRVGFQMQWSY